MSTEEPKKPTKATSSRKALSDQRFGGARRRSREGRGGIEAGQESHVNGGSALIASTRCSLISGIEKKATVARIMLSRK
jgi:hypothetical protein